MKDLLPVLICFLLACLVIVLAVFCFWLLLLLVLASTLAAVFYVLGVLAGIIE